MSEFEIFDAAHRIADPELRLAYLESACGDNPQLRNKVDELLRSHDRAEALLQCATGDSVDAESAADQPASPGSNVEGEVEESRFDFLGPSTQAGSLGKLSHYEILSVLGSGAFGTVFKAFDESLHRTVAIKVLSRELAATSPARKRFLREARSAAAIRHENVVHIYSVEEKPRPFLVMEYIPGETLQQRLDQNGPLDLPDVLRLGQQIASGLAAAHIQGLVHRDIKPSNILLETGSDDWVKISDFGLARAADDASITQSGVIAGTPLYMAPEQALGATVDQRADLFSLGSVLYVMVSGRPPFRAPTTLAVLKRVTEEQARPIREIIPDVPAWLCGLISKLHAKRPEDRIQSAKEVADLLSQHLNAQRQPVGLARMPSMNDTETVQYQPHSRSMESNSPKSKRPTRWRVVLGYTFLIVGLMVLGVIGFQLANRDRGTPVKDDAASTTPETNPAAAAKNSVPANVPSTVADASPATNFAAERAAAEWVLAIGGDVTLRDSNDQPVPVLNRKLPSGDFIVQNVDIYDNQFNAEDLACLQGCEKLDIVAFSRTSRLTDSALGHLEGSRIKNLAFTDCPSLTSRATRTIGTVRGLMRLNLQSLGFADDGVADLESLKQLDVVNCGLTRMTDLGLTQLAKACPQITELAIWQSSDQRQTVRALEAFPNLNKVFINGDQFTEDAIKVFNAHPTLGTLNIVAPLGDPTIHRLKHLERIRRLFIQSHGAEDKAPVSEATYRKAIWPDCVQDLFFVGQAVTPRDHDLLRFARCPNLKTLGIDSASTPSRLTQSGIDAFQKMRPDIRLAINHKDYPPTVPKPPTPAD